MLEVMLVSFVVFVLAFFGLAIGWIFSQKVLKGSCGGLAAMQGEKQCSSCATPCEKRRKLLEQQAQQNPAS